MLTILTVAVMVPLSVFFLETRRDDRIPFESGTSESFPVEIFGFSRRDGIYFVPVGTTASSLLASIGIEVSEFEVLGMGDAPLERGALIHREGNGVITIGDMRAAKKIALGVPLNVNRVTRDDLVLIPGVKDATAAAIVAFRQASGGRIKTMEDLLHVRGIKEKRLAILKRYLCVADDRRSAPLYGDRKDRR